ncbi:uncharacterized protein LOC113282148 isoform X2 [Papaver somniferum]|uniref:uncharacterized protein LOC113282148 isoform X2 n=1 Tax=Papaver somniferum TaxID=3469 RepID=UPI000E6FB534|nr:uncharacterized protein LOC113282148 isoform X2 [Papaver somniferum]
MASLSLKTVGPSPSSAFSGANEGSSTTRSKRLTLVRNNRFQVRNERITEQQPKSHKVESVSRRDAMLSAGLWDWVQLGVHIPYPYPPTLPYPPVF